MQGECCRLSADNLNLRYGSSGYWGCLHHSLWRWASFSTLLVSDLLIIQCRWLAALAYHGCAACLLGSTSDRGTVLCGTRGYLKNGNILVSSSKSPPFTQPTDTLSPLALYGPESRSMNGEQSGFLMGVKCHLLEDIGPGPKMGHGAMQPV